jgi:acetyl esterase
MPYHPQVDELRKQLARDGAPALYTLSIDEARAADLKNAVATAGRGEPVGRVHDASIPGPGGPVPVRVYWPAGEGPWPVLVYFFGGGWCLGTLDTCDGVCRMLTNSAGCVTVAVGYRLAPEHKFPAAVQDCYAGTAWAAAHSAQLRALPGKLAIGGDSAGGNLAAAVALRARTQGGPGIAHQLLVYPNTDHDARTESMSQPDDPHFFCPASARWYWDHYLSSPADGADPLASPLRADDLSGLPPATVITAEYDPLRDEGEEYARRLAADGVPTTLTRYEGMMHGFFTMIGTLDVAREAVEYAAGQLRAAWRD